MNDFTKEELEWLYESVDYCIEEFQEQNPAYSVRDKLKIMLNNYQEDCEKSWPSNMIKPCPECKRFHDE